MSFSNSDLRNQHPAFYELRVPSGMESVAVNALEEDLGLRTSDVETESGLVRVSGDVQLDSLTGLGYISSVGVGIGSVNSSGMEAAANHFAKLRWPQLGLGKKPGSFRLRFMDSGQLVSVAGRGAQALAQSITEGTGLRVDAHRAQQEFWLDRRRGTSTFRLVIRDVLGEKLQAGELPASTAGLLVRCFAPQSTDVFWDPFAGSGSIAKARQRYPAKSLLASDRAPFQRTVFPVKKADVFDDAVSRKILRSSIPDVVISDLPWASHDPSIRDLPHFYERVMRCLIDLVSSSARCTFLVGRDDAAVAAMHRFMSWSCDPLPVLISGHKATVLTGHVARNPTGTAEIV